MGTWITDARYVTVRAPAGHGSTTGAPGSGALSGFDRLAGDVVRIVELASGVLFLRELERDPRDVGVGGCESGLRHHDDRCRGSLGDVGVGDCRVTTGVPAWRAAR